MKNKSFAASILVGQSPKEVFNAINNVRGWWSEEINGNTEKLNDVFDYHYKELHRCKMKLVEVIPNKKVVWQVLDNYFNFTKDESEWKGDNVIFEISEKDNKTLLTFMQDGLVPEYECYNACVNGWTFYVQESLKSLIETGKGKPNTNETAWTINEVAARFNELAQAEKWVEIQDELFTDDVKSIEPPNSPYMVYAEGKAAVREKGLNWMKRIEEVHSLHTTEPVIGGSHFAIGRQVDITVQGLGRLQIKEIMLYEVRDSKIISEQFFY